MYTTSHSHLRHANELGTDMMLVELKTITPKWNLDQLP